MRWCLTILLLAGLAPAALAQRRDEQMYYPGSFNWRFLAEFPAAARLFNAFDYGHAALYEELLTDPPGAIARLEGDEFDFLTTDLLVRPPRFAIAEEAVMPRYARLAWRAKQMFDWAHLLHRQIYDVYADDRIADGDKPALVERITDYYLSNRALAFVAVPKSMALMDDAYYSGVFRRRAPRFNGLIWAYHWLQVGLYDAFLGPAQASDRPAAVAATVVRFHAMLADPPHRLPDLMPLTPAVAPRFAARHPRAAAIFDNLHMMHDIISDILASEKVPAARKAAVIAEALEEFRNGSRNTMSLQEWRGMAEMMGGVRRMGGVAWPAPPSR
jgi:hypothetical protein